MKSKNTKKTSYFIDKYNNLNGTVITREKLKQFAAELRVSKLIAKNNTINDIYKNLTSILRNNPRHKSFKITIKRKVFIQKIKNTKKKQQKQLKEILDENGQYALLGATKNNPLQKLGFIPANSKITNPKDVFTLKGNLGKFIQRVQRVKELILIKGDKHSNKSQLAMQLANGFGELGLKVSYIDYEQGGLISKDTQNSKQWNTTKKGLENMQIVGFLNNPFADLELIAQNTDVIVVDSITDLRITANQMNDLRNKYQDVIWVFISQVKADGKMYGGNKMAHNPTKVIHCHTARNHNERYATLEKNRGNDLEPKYAISSKSIIKTSLNDKEGLKGVKYLKNKKKIEISQ